MKVLIPLASILLFTFPATECKQKSSDTGTTKTYKGKLEIKALCMNYTIRLTEGTLDTSQVVANWTDESTGKSYKNVFGLGNPCDFPATIKEGDEFTFTIVNVKDRDCAVCMAYYPTPKKKLMIKVAP